LKTNYLMKLYRITVCWFISLSLMLNLFSNSLFAESAVKVRTAELNKLLANDDGKKDVDAPKAEHEEIVEDDIALPEETIDVEEILKETSVNEQERISLNFVNGDLQNMLRTIARSANVNLIVSSDVTGTLTIELNDIPWESAFKYVLNSCGYSYVREGNIIRVMSSEDIEQEPLTVEVIPLNYAKAKEVQPKVISLLTPERGSIQSDDRSNTLIINDIPAKISQIKKVVERLDKATPQVLIEVKYVEILVGDSDREGIDWSTLGDYSIMLNEMLYTFDREVNESVSRLRASGTDQERAQAYRDYEKNTTRATTYQLAPDDFKLTMSLLMNSSKAKIISNPKVQTLDNREATIKVAETMYKPTFSYNKETGTYEVNKLEEIYIGVTLEVTPHINYDDFITLDIVPEVSSLAGYQVIQGVEIPNTNIRKVEARVSLKDTYTVAIGGMIKDELIKSKKGIPYLSEWPYIGKYLFAWESKELQKVNLIIFITPTIIKPDKEIKRWDNQLREMQLTRDGEWHDIVSNYPSWHMLAIHEQELLAAATNFVEDVELEGIE